MTATDLLITILLFALPVFGYFWGYGEATAGSWTTRRKALRSRVRRLRNRFQESLQEFGSRLPEKVRTFWAKPENRMATGTTLFLGALVVLSFLVYYKYDDKPIPDFRTESVGILFTVVFIEFFVLKRVETYQQKREVLVQLQSQDRNVAISGAQTARDRGWLAGANLYWANLNGAPLGGANLNKATFHGTQLKKANLRNASLKGAVFGLWYHDHMSNEIEIEVDLTGADLEGADLTGVQMSETNMHDAFLFRAKLHNACLKGVDLSEATLCEADLRCSRLHRTCFDKAHLSLADIRGAELGPHGKTAPQQPGHFQTASDLTSASLAGADLHWTIYDRTTLWPSDFDPARDAPDAINTDRLDEWVGVYEPERGRFVYAQILEWSIEKRKFKVEVIDSTHYDPELRAHPRQEWIAPAYNPNPPGYWGLHVFSQFGTHFILKRRKTLPPEIQEMLHSLRTGEVSPAASS